MFRTLYKDPKRYVRSYWSSFENIYLSGDVARKDKDGISGYRVVKMMF